MAHPHKFALHDDTGNVSANTLIAALITCVVLCLLCIGFVDRPVADWVNTFSAETKSQFGLLSKIVLPVPYTATLIGFGYAIAIALGHRPAPRELALLRIVAAILIAIALKDQFKIIFGRTWPATWTANNPSYLKDGVYGFFPTVSWFTSGGSRAYHAFPSGTTAVMTAACVSIAVAWRPFRWIAPVLVTAVIAGLIGANFHWVSDTIAGLVLGTAVALATHRFGRT
jgi:membrane-associated phospholipid phosphatase